MIMLRKAVFTLLALFITPQALADGMGDFPSLWESHDPRLQEQLEGILSDLGLDAGLERDRGHAATLASAPLKVPTLKVTYLQATPSSFHSLMTLTSNSSLRES